MAIIIVSRVQDILDFEIFLVLFDVKCRGCERKTGFERCGSDEVKEGNMEDVMKMTHRGGKVELVSLQSDPLDNFVRTKALPIEFLRWTGGGDV
jgi:hypothetical protein